MNGRMKKGVIGCVMLILGFAIFMNTEPILLMMCGIFLFGMGVITLYGAIKGDKKTLISETVDMVVDAQDFEAQPDKTALEKSLTLFREHYHRYFRQPEITENPPVQEDCTQLFTNMLALQKARLRRMGITLDFQARRMAYGNGRNVKEKNYFDGKYEISEVSEDIEAIRNYRSDGKIIFTKHNSEAARYTLINAKQIDQNHVICPNCGAAQPRENLLDGCDFCHTKFTVEDLGRKIASFALRDDYELQYAKFAKTRPERFGRTYFHITAIFSVFWMFAMLVLMFDEGGFWEPALPFYLLSMVAISVCFGAILGFPFAAVYFLLVVPVKEAKAAYKRYSEQQIEQMKQADKRDKAIEKIVKQKDPLFSINGFYSNVQNKLATVFFADTKEQINAFAEGDLSGYLHEFEQVFDFEAEDLDLQSYRVENGLQIADVKADLRLFVKQDRQAAEKKRIVKIRLVKNADCKTQAVCAPFVMKCSGCGASLSLEQGLVCEYCGSKDDLKQYDWAISEFQ